MSNFKTVLNCTLSGSGGQLDSVFRPLTAPETEEEKEMERAGKATMKEWVDEMQAGDVIRCEEHETEVD